MKKFANFVCKNKIFILILSIVLLIPSIFGYVTTKINYDILVYLPSDIETLKGENILTDDFNMGAFSIVVVDNKSDKQLMELEDKFKSINGVKNVVSINDIIGTTIPLEILPNDIRSKVSNGSSKLVLVTFYNSTSDDITLSAVESMRNIADENIKIGGMSAMVLDTKELFNSEMLLYVIIAVILCIIVLELSLDSYLVPILLMINIGFSILLNMGSNIIFGEISYITKAIAAVLQLGVTTDFSIFLYHKYEKAKENNDNFTAMSNAICETFTSVFGSSFTTVAGFLALCTMNLTLGVDIGLVMAKGVLIGVICVLTLFPSLLLVFDKLILKTKHKKLLPKFNMTKNFVVKHYKLIFIIFLILLFPSYLAQNKTNVYYKLDESIPDDYGYSIATKTLKDDYKMVTQEIVLLSTNTDNYTTSKLVNEIKNVKGISLVINPSSLSEYGITENMIPENIKKIYQTDKYKMIIIASDYDIATNELNNQVEEINKIIKKYDKDAILAGEGPLMKDLVTTTDEDFHNVNYTSVFVIFIIMMIVLKSISLPFLLVITIEEAIFINMGIPYFTGTSIPFIASVVIGTIQLGATIDYAILMTTKYLEERKSGKDKINSIKTTLDSSINSIFVSAMCFFAATIGVGIVSKIDMIGSLCTLIARGAIISMIIVIFVLPSILLIFDKLICKTTILKGEKMKKSNIKKNIKKVSLSLLVSMLFINTVPVYALTKDETVYAKLENTGKVEKIIVNEHLINDDNLETISDLSNLKDILNINGNETYNINENNIIWSSNKNDIFYQGTIDQELPISLDIKYYLNNEEKSVDEIIGKSGKVKIDLKYINNDIHKVKVNGKYENLYTPFVVTVATIIDSNNNYNISINNGKVINNGEDNIVVGLISPGLYESLKLDDLKGFDTISLSFETTNFELSSIYSIITPKLIDSNDLEVFDKLDSLNKNVNELNNKMDEIESATTSLVKGSKLINDNMSLIHKNLNIVYNKLGDLESGSNKLSAGINQLISKLNQVSSSIELPDSKKIDELNYLVKSNTKAIESINALNNTIKNNYDKYNLNKFSIDEIMKFTSDTYLNFNLKLSDKEVSDMNIKLSSIKTNYETNLNMVNLLNNNNKAIDETLKSLNAINNLKPVVNTLKDSLTKLQNGANTLNSGISQIRSGVGNLNDKFSQLLNGTNNLYDGMNKLQQGVSKYNKEGIKTLNSYSNKLNSVGKKMDALIKLGEEYNTFTMKNDDCEGKTKFVMVIDSIKNIKEETNVEPVVEKEGLWTRIKNLFK